MYSLCQAMTRHCRHVQIMLTTIHVHVSPSEVLGLAKWIVIWMITEDYRAYVDP